MCSRKVRSETLWTVTPSRPLTTSTISSACSLSVAEQVTSTTRRSWRDSATSSAVTMPPAEAMPVATRPTTAGSTSVCSRIVIEYDALVAARRFFGCARLVCHACILPGPGVTGESAVETLSSQRRPGRGAGRRAAPASRRARAARVRVQPVRDEVVDEQHRAAVERLVEGEVEAAADCRDPLGRVGRALPGRDVGVDDVPAADDGQLEVAGQPLGEVAGQLRAAGRLDVDDPGRPRRPVGVPVAEHLEHGVDERTRDRPVRRSRAGTARAGSVRGRGR